MSLHFKRLAEDVCYPNETVSCLDDNLASEFVSGTMPQTAQTKVERHLAGCRDCRQLVAALAGADDVDSNVATHPHEKLSESQAGKLPVLSIGDRVGRYLVLSTLGSGGMGQVFAAYDPQLDRKIALKVLRANLGANAKEARTRLKREAQAIAQLNHPNVVGVYDVGTTDNGDDVYIAMEFVEGDTLTTWLKRWPRTWREILEVFHQAARGLMAAHSVGLLHRDFKPDNVLVGSDGRVRVTDFGLARSLFGLDDSGRGPVSIDAIRAGADGSPLHVDLTATGTVLGTPRYMPPEQLTGPNIDARSDQFSFCVALYEALYAKHPLVGNTSVAMLERGEPATPPPEGTRVPATVARAVMRGLEKERSKRFPTLAAMITELTPPVERATTRFAAVAIFGLLIVGGATAAVMASHRETKLVPEHDEETVRLLIDQINRLETEVRQLRKRVLERDVMHEQDLKELEHEKEILTEKETQIATLVDQVTKLRIDKVVPKSGAATQSVRVTQAIVTAQHDLEGCFDEWAGRPLSAEAVGATTAQKPRPTDSDVVVTLSVTPDGVGNAALAKSEDTDRSPSLKFCVESAIARVKYPPGPETLELSVSVAWAAPDMVNMSARVVGHHEAPKRGVDL